MDGNLVNRLELKPDVELQTQICRCCLSTEKEMRNVVAYSCYIEDLTGLKVSESDSLPQSICSKCCTFIVKAVRIKWKLIKAHDILYSYSTRCAPFPIDAQDPELNKYSSPHLSVTDTLTFDTCGRSKLGFSKILQHSKNILHSELNNRIQLELFSVNKLENVKEEDGFSDYEDNIPLDEYRSTSNKITETDLSDLLNACTQYEIENAPSKDEGKKQSREKRKEKKVKKRKKLSVDIKETAEPKSSVRKTLEVDPNKIKVITLNPQEQIKHREEESKAGLKFPFQCNLCFKGFNFEVKLQNHMTKHSPSRGGYECKLCSMYFPTAYSHSVHTLIHTRRYECVECGRRMIDKQSIVDHYKTEHEGLFTVYTCHVCGKVSNNNKTHRGHMRNHHSGERPNCDQCGKSFINKDSLVQHLQIHEGVKNYECGECGKRCRTRTQLKLHLLKHTDVREYYCVECDVRFKSAQSLRQHLKKNLKHKDKKSFKFACSRCPKRLETLAQLSAHMRIQHEGVRPHRCAQCPAALATRSSLAKHVRAVHSARKDPPRHVCDTCGKAFTGKSVLTNHVRTHTGEKPYSCAECGRKFTQRTAMRTHVKLVHLKIRRTAKIKPEVPLDDGKIAALFAKEETPLVFDNWNRQPLHPCDTYFSVTAGP